VATALAAVGYGRFFRRRWITIAATLGVATLALIVAAGLLDQQSAGSSSYVTAVVAMVAVTGCGAFVGLLRAGIGIRRLIRANLGLAASHATGVVQPEWRAGPKRTRLLFTLLLVCLPVVIVVMLIWRQYCPSIVALIFFIGTVAGGPGWDGMTYAATMSAGGIDLPTWRTRIPWTSVSTVTIGAGNELCIAVNGPFEMTGSLPRRWARRIATALQPGKTIRLTIAYPELGLWTAQHHLTTTRWLTAPGSSPMSSR
jgi:hypothetical protein